MLKRKTLLATAVLAVLFNIISGNAYAALPEVRFLGGHPDTYTKESDEVFVIKKVSPFRFINQEDGNSYTTQGQHERVWISNAEWNSVYHDWKSFGEVSNNCKVKYVAIDDDEDSRINRFYIGDDVVHTMDQGMVVKGEFTVKDGGELKLYAEDSIALFVEVCEEPEPEDVCPNIDGMQTTVPEGYYINDDGDCVKDPVDVCPNIDGMQTTVPEGYYIDDDGDCVEPEDEEIIHNIRFSIKKEVRKEGNDKWREKVTDVEKDEVVEFKITIKNKSTEGTDDADEMKMKDVLPDEMERVGGSGLTEYWDDFEPGEKKTFTIKAKVKDVEYEGSADKCIVNEASVLHDGDTRDTDTATVCYGTGEILGLPETGPSASIAFAFMGLSSVFGGVVVRRKRQ
jgi:LPXTG-motif cell wall-anchored protein